MKSTTGVTFQDLRVLLHQVIKSVNQMIVTWLYLDKDN